MPIDYARMNREMPKLKASLTRAKKTGDPVKVLDSVEKAVNVFDEVGGWPDQWATWRIALDDAFYRFSRSEARDVDVYENEGVITARFHSVADRFAW